MAYNQFTLPDIEARFGLTIRTRTNLFGHLPPVAVDPSLKLILSRHEPLALAVNTEKARSELLIAPLLAEVWRLGNDTVSLHSGTRFDVSEADGLVGVCDFIMGRGPQLHYVTAPILMIVEAKNEDIAGGLGQCAAAMRAAQQFNSRYNPDLAIIYGAVTDGGEWKFMQLRNALLEIDLTDYRINQPERLMGIMVAMMGLAPFGLSPTGLAPTEAAA